MIDIKATFQDLADDSRMIQDVREISVSKILEEDINNMFSIIPGIKGGQQVAALKTIEYVTRSSQGCGGTSLSPKFPSISQKWNPQECEVKIKYCYTEFKNKFTQWGLGNGYKIKDLNEASFMDFIKWLVAEAVKLDMQRIALLGDEDIATQNVLADTNKEEFYDLIGKGLIPTLQYFKTIPELAENFITLDKNTGTTQFNLDNDYALNLYEEVVDVDDFDGDILMSSNKLAKNYTKYLKRLGGLESSKEEIQKGIQNLEIDGAMILPVKHYDRWRKVDFKKDDGGGNLVTHLPHFAIHTRKEFLQIGVDDINALSDLTFEYIGGDDEHFYIKGHYMMDFKMTNPYDFKAAL